ncbi:exopolysaccharide production protein YjbE [Sodalis sp. C49]|uniref:exopolysaccharide production protein YjbE n=1 Tax=unclassified Sodalis (in: enterobacteria) TaxID=2636512 RepID=UPI0039658DD1
MQDIFYCIIFLYDAYIRQIIISLLYSHHPHESKVINMNKLFSVVMAAMLMASGSYALAATPGNSSGNTETASGLSAGAATAVGVGAVALLAGVALIGAHNDDNGDGNGNTGTGTTTSTVQ